MTSSTTAGGPSGLEGGGCVGAVLGMSVTALVVIALVVGWASLLKYVAYRVHTRDGDTFGNRLAGRGPDNEVPPPTAGDEWRLTRERLRRSTDPE